jgi:hypothetical protein
MGTATQTLPFVSSEVETRQGRPIRFSALACPEHLPLQAVEGLEANGK